MITFELLSIMKFLNLFICLWHSFQIWLNAHLKNLFYQSGLLSYYDLLEIFFLYLMLRIKFSNNNFSLLSLFLFIFLPLPLSLFFSFFFLSGFEVWQYGNVLQSWSSYNTDKSLTTIDWEECCNRFSIQLHPLEEVCGDVLSLFV